MVTIHHLLNSRSERVIWLMEELEEPYELKVYRREPDMSAPAAYRALHPIGTSPILSDGEVVLAETGAIVTYVLDRYGRGRLEPPRGTADHARFIQWLHFAEGGAACSITTEALLAAATHRFEPGPRAKGLIRLWQDRNQRMIPFLEDELARAPYFAGPQFTAADVMMHYVFGLYDRFVRPIDDRPRIAEYRARVAARPAYTRAHEIAAREEA